MIRIQTTRDGASNCISGIRFAQHPNAPQGGKLLVSEPVDPDTDAVKALLSLDGVEPAPAYAEDVLDAIDDAIADERASAGRAITAAVDQNVAELQAANVRLADELVEKNAQIRELKRQVGETAVAELREEITRLQERVKDAEAGNGGGDTSALEAENGRLRSANEALGAESQSLRATITQLEADKAKLTEDLAAATALLDDAGKPADGESAPAADAEGKAEGASKKSQSRKGS